MANISLDEQYLSNALGGIKGFLLDFRHIFMLLLGCGFIYEFVHNKIDATTFDVPKANYDFNERISAERPMLKARHPVNFSIKFTSYTRKLS